MSKVEKINLLNKISHFADVLFVVFYFLSLLFAYKQNVEIELYMKWSAIVMIVITLVLRIIKSFLKKKK